MKGVFWIYKLFIIIILFVFLSSFKIEKNYNSIISEQQTGTVTDIEGNTYKTIKIGNQWWMAENLRTTKFNDGTSIPMVSNDSAWSVLKTPAYCWYANDELNKNVYGALYNWFTIQTNKLCPKGWHVPTDEEWTALSKYLGKMTGSKLKEAGTTHWSVDTLSNSKFNALPGGSRFGLGTFGGIGDEGLFWTATMCKNVYAWCRYLYYNNAEIGRNNAYKTDGFSVRCVKD